MNKLERDDCKTSYVKYKLFKRDIYIYILAVVDTGNLVGGKMSENGNAIE